MTPFAPLQDLADTLLARAAGSMDDGSHDISHLQRVWKNACLIQAGEGGDLEILLAAVVLHDCVAVEKNSSLRAQASRLSGRQAAAILADLGWSPQRVQAVRHAVEAHSYSAKIPARTLEARIVQDADRLDAIGMVGVARCFYVGGRLGLALYDPADPHARQRACDDGRYTIDHFHSKLLKLGDGFSTAQGRAMAQIRQQRMMRFLQEFHEEL